jgi:hypothetical protein
MADVARPAAVIADSVAVTVSGTRTDGGFAFIAVLPPSA